MVEPKPLNARYPLLLRKSYPDVAASRSPPSRVVPCPEGIIPPLGCDAGRRSGIRTIGAAECATRANGEFTSRRTP